MCPDLEGIELVNSWFMYQYSTTELHRPGQIPRIFNSNNLITRK